MTIFASFADLFSAPAGTIFVPLPALATVAVAAVPSRRHLRRLHRARRRHSW